VKVPGISKSLERFATWRQWLRTDEPPPRTSEELPLRSDLYSVEQLQRHARAMAQSHRLADRRMSDKFLARLDENEAILVEAYDLLIVAVDRDRRISPAAEWLLDNFYLIEEQIRSARRHLPPSYSRELPCLAGGESAHHPRVYAIALELIAHVDGRVDTAGLNGFVASYQTVVPLKLGELWAVPIMLRLALIENLRRVAVRIAVGRRDRDAALEWAAKMSHVVEHNPSDLVLVLADMARADPNLSGAFLAELTRHLQGQSPHFAFAYSWLEHRLSEQGLTVERLILAEGQEQAADQVSIGNSINSLRFLSSTDWRQFVEGQSVVEQVLGEDPAKVYDGMDFTTRDQYRHAVEQIAKLSRRSEQDVARKAILLAQARADKLPIGGETGAASGRGLHVGYYLIDRGRPELERLVAMPWSGRLMLARLARRYSLPLYLGSVLVLTAAAAQVFLVWCGSQAASATALWILLFPALLCALQLAISVVNWLAMALVKPRPLVRMGFREGIPPEHRTMVVVPTILSSAALIEHLLDGLEVRYLANRGGNLHFALLTDFEDAAQEHKPGDEELLRLAAEGIEALNEKYEAERSGIFFLFHRPRRWNAQERLWMGYERKRGKLAEFNGLLRGSGERFSRVVGDRTVLSSVRYVITLDTDTQLPRDAARALVGAMAHPLNRPVFDPRRRRIVEGYGILQPRVGVSLSSARRSWFVRLFAGECGLDPYTRVVSDLYQDLFGEGSFIGKGIYDVDAFQRTCGEFPENVILSHDLLESAHARSGLLSDVELYEEYPARYPVDLGRRHRWVRGDWQIAGWLLPWVRGCQARRIANPISVLSWWKIFDNLRRSLLPAAVVSLLLGCWMLLPSPLATLWALSALGTSPLLAILSDLSGKPIDLPLLSHCRVTLSALGRSAVQFLFTLALLPYEAYIHLDAILRTVLRVLWTKRRLLEWQTFSEAEQFTRDDLSAFLRSMWMVPLAVVFILVPMARLARPSLPVAAPLLAMWAISPLLAWWLSRPILPRRVHLSDRQRVFLEKLSRRTWRYFEVFVTQEDNWLPPDNVQEQPGLIVACRTSPTNIGIALLANLAACDFGYCSVAGLLDRTLKTLGTLQGMERYRGHFYNWYDTRSCKPLPPLYVSTVDSGNLAGHLLVLGQGLLQLLDAKVLSARMLGGLRDTWRVLLDVAGRSLSAAPLRGIAQMESLLENPPTLLRDAATCLQRLALAAKQLTGELGADTQARWWAGALERACADHLDDLRHVAAWTALPAMPAQAAQSYELRAILATLNQASTLQAIAVLEGSLLPSLDALIAGSPADAGREWLGQLRLAIADSSQRCAQRIQALRQVAALCQELADMDFSFLFDKSRDLFAIGYNVHDHRLDGSFYDLLASEARLGSFVATAQDQVGQEHWFALGRMLTRADHASALLSWSGSMFEYLMPLLVMPTYANTLLDQTCHAIVRRQIQYGRQRGVPWGISESGYNAVDAQMNYQYRAFGVPGLGLKRGLADDLVIAPYASALALVVEPEAACRNLQRLEADGQSGPYGFYEAIDYTPLRLPPGQASATVRQFMAHHQGMSLLALASALLQKPMQRRFAADPMLRAADLLLQERVPKASAPVFPHAAEANARRPSSAEDEGMARIFTSPGGAAPEVHLLSNGQYHVVITSAGGGYSRWRDLAVTRWREDATRDCWGTFFYVRDLNSGVFWSTAFQPTLKNAKPYEAIFTQGRAEFRRRDQGIETHTEITVSPEDDVEVRRLTITNHTDLPRTIEITSYAEVVLAPQAQDLSHPAFSNLFVQTELVPSRQAILCTRRPRSAQEQPPWLVHLMTVGGSTFGEASFETDRMAFIGRGRSLIAPAAMENRSGLSNSQGPVLDPVISIRQVVRLKASETVRVDCITGVAPTRQGVTVLMDRYHDPHLADRIFELAWTHSQIVLHQLNASEVSAQLYGRLAGSVIYASSLRRAAASAIFRNRRGQSGLWGYGISGDLPIVLVRIGDRNRLDLIRHVVQAHAYWRMKGLSVDMVIWNEDHSGYRQTLQDAILDLVASSPEAALVDKPGGIFVRRGEQMSEDDRALLQAVARVALFDDAGTFAEQVERRGRSDVVIPLLRPLAQRQEPAAAVAAPQRDLAFFNGLGGFSRDGREYIVILAAGQETPAPWINVIANPQFGTVVSESGAAYTWWRNSHEFRLTPWRNDPVGDTCGEAIYLRDETSGRFWSPSPAPARGAMSYIVRHGFGYTIFEYEEDGIVTELALYVATDAPVKIARLRITNRSGRPRQLSVTAYWELVLGELRDKTLMHVTTEVDPVSGAIFARNPYSAEFAGSVVFVDGSESLRTITTDRGEFLGRNGTVARPAALRRVRLSGRVGAALDPCAAMQVQVSLEDCQTREIAFTLGAAEDAEQARQLVYRFHGTANAQQTLERVWHYWSRTLGAVHFETPDPAVNFLANGWLIYQTLACRMWARTGFYQSGGAFGFRDQLQDAMALVYAEPPVLRQHLLNAAARQFREGDVQHWWHPPAGRGVRTHFSDDYLWLAAAVCRYVQATGDTGVLEERIPFLSGRQVADGEDAYYDLPRVSDDVGTLYQHCLRAIDNGLRFGAHGLPLMGCGDWNDGMNLVGAQGQGESVWLAFFLYDVLSRFAVLARQRGDVTVADRYTIEAGRLRGNIEEHGWDGQWYRRAYFDDGTPLGSAANPECQIDSLPQSWSVLSGAAPRQRSVTAMDHVLSRLVHRDPGYIQLLDPPFDKSSLNPGYIKGYVPGVRENGGQYTHGAIWAIMAMAQLGDGDRAWDLFSLINPIFHGDSAQSISTYRVEPYVAVADVYAVAPHIGRGGWTWYTGSAGWMYRLISESLLGLHLQVDKLRLTPRIPATWPEFKVHYRYRETFYHITIRNGGGMSVRRIVADGAEQAEKVISLVDDRTDHNVEVDLGPEAPAA